MGRMISSKCVARILTVAMFFQLLPPISFTNAAEPSNDISGHWAESVITQWQTLGLVEGYDDGSFHPDQEITRAEFIRFLNQSIRAGSTSQPESPISFTDVKKSDWYYDEIQIAVTRGYVLGFEDGSFHPNDPVTRAQAASFIKKALRLPDDPDTALNATDFADLPEWAIGDIGATLNGAYMSGYPDGSFQANRNMTRAEAISTLDRVMLPPGSEEISRPEKREPASTADLVISEGDTLIKDETVEGNVIIDKSVGDGNVTFDNVEIKGNIMVEGGGSQSIHMIDSSILGEMELLKPDVRVVFEGNTSVETVHVSQSAVLDSNNFTGNLGAVFTGEGLTTSDTVTVKAPLASLTLDGKATVKLHADVSDVTASESAKNAKISIEKGVSVSKFTANSAVYISGDGAISVLNANASGVRTQIKANTLNVAKGITTPIQGASVTTASSGGSSGGSSSGGGSSGGGSSGGTDTDSKSTVKVSQLLLTTDTTFEAVMPKNSDTRFELTNSLEAKSIAASAEYKNDRYYVSLSDNLEEAKEYTITVSQNGKRPYTTVVTYLEPIPVTDVTIKEIKTSTHKNASLVKVIEAKLETPLDSASVVTENDISRFVTILTQSQPKALYPYAIKPSGISYQNGVVTLFLPESLDLDETSGILSVNGVPESTEDNYSFIQPTLANATLYRSGPAKAVLQFTPNKAGKYYYVTRENDAELPPPASAELLKQEAGVTSGAITAAKETITIPLSDLEQNDTKDFYIIMEDLFGNFSKITALHLSKYKQIPSPTALSIKDSETNNANWINASNQNEFTVSVTFDASEEISGIAVLTFTDQTEQMQKRTFPVTVSNETSVIDFPINDMALPDGPLSAAAYFVADGVISSPAVLERIVKDTIPPQLTLGEVKRHVSSDGQLEASFMLSSSESIPLDEQDSNLRSGIFYGQNVQTLLSDGISTSLQTPNIEERLLIGLDAAGPSTCYAIAVDQAGNQSELLAIDIPGMPISETILDRISPLSNGFVIDPGETAENLYYRYTSGQTAPSWPTDLSADQWEELNGLTIINETGSFYVEIAEMKEDIVTAWSYRSITAPSSAQLDNVTPLSLSVSEPFSEIAAVGPDINPATGQQDIHLLLPPLTQEAFAVVDSEENLANAGALYYKQNGQSYPLNWKKDNQTNRTYAYVPINVTVDARQAILDENGQLIDGYLLIGNKKIYHLAYGKAKGGIYVQQASDLANSQLIINLPFAYTEKEIGLYNESPHFNSFEEDASLRGIVGHPTSIEDWHLLQEENAEAVIQNLSSVSLYYYDNSYSEMNVLYHAAAPAPQHDEFLTQPDDKQNYPSVALPPLATENQYFVPQAHGDNSWDQGNLYFVDAAQKHHRFSVENINGRNVAYIPFTISQTEFAKKFEQTNFETDHAAADAPQLVELFQALNPSALPKNETVTLNVPVAYTDKEVKATGGQQNFATFADWVLLSAELTDKQQTIIPVAFEDGSISAINILYSQAKNSSRFTLNTSTDFIVPQAIDGQKHPLAVFLPDVIENSMFTVLSKENPTALAYKKEDAQIPLPYLEFEGKTYAYIPFEIDTDKKIKNYGFGKQAPAIPPLIVDNGATITIGIPFAVYDNTMAEGTDLNWSAIDLPKNYTIQLWFTDGTENEIPLQFSKFSVLAGQEEQNSPPLVEVPEVDGTLTQKDTPSLAPVEENNESGLVQEKELPGENASTLN